MGSTYNSCALNNNARRAVGRPVARRRRRRGARGGPRNPLAEPGFSLSSYTIASEPGRYPRRVDPAWKKAEWNLICPKDLSPLGEVVNSGPVCVSTGARQQYEVIREDFLSRKLQSH